LLTGLVLTLPVLLMPGFLRLLGWIPGPTKRAQVFLFIGIMLPAVFCSAVSLLMIDNFTYTLFKVGIVTSRGFVRGAYALLAIGLLAVWYRQIILNIRIRHPIESDNGITTARSWPTAWLKGQSWLVIVVLAVSLVVGLGRILSGNHPTSEKKFSWNGSLISSCLEGMAW
jgi:hypothetical protein